MLNLIFYLHFYGVTTERVNKKEPVLNCTEGGRGYGSVTSAVTSCHFCNDYILHSFQCNNLKPAVSFGCISTNHDSSNNIKACENGRLLVPYLLSRDSFVDGVQSLVDAQDA